jgi:hypothetical protein
MSEEGLYVRVRTDEVLDTKTDSIEIGEYMEPITGFVVRGRL